MVSLKVQVALLLVVLVALDVCNADILKEIKDKLEGKKDDKKDDKKEEPVKPSEPEKKPSKECKDKGYGQHPQGHGGYQYPQRGNYGYGKK
ncbi:hypothetical protein L9F63_000243 [Diploptera punctata]|uniref:Uncharacterized protein n=1 Tax=Diploptera punctata TaxID=6984 RepID=A0AAD8ETJ7_DIPPU|nr:hypothetical protein L9F63_000243 [Diploptera punctata]